MPFLPARPVRPERCCSVSASRGSSTWTTSDSFGRSMPRAATSVATQHPGATVAQRLQRVVALVLAMLAGQGDGVEAALDQAGVEMADIVARRAEQHRRLRLVQAQQVDHRMLDIGRRDGDRLVGDVAMAAILADRRDAQGVALVALGERDDRLRAWSRRTGACGAPAGSRRESPRDPRGSPCRASRRPRRARRRAAREVERAALEMVAQAARRADDDMGAVRQARRSFEASMPPTQVAIRAPALP